MKIATSSRAWLLCLLVSSAVLRNTAVVGYQDSSQQSGQENDDDDDDDDDDNEEVYDPALEDPLDACRRNPTWKGNGNISYEKCQALTGYKPRDELNRSNNYLSVETKDTIGRCIDAKFRAAAAVTAKAVKAAAKAKAAAAAKAAKKNDKDEDEEEVTIKHPWTQCNELDRTDVCKVQKTDLHGFYTHKNDGDILTISDALTEQETFGIQALVDCMHNILPIKEDDSPFYEERTFGLEPTDENGEDLYNENQTGNAVTYMHGLLQLFLPGVASTVYRLVTESYHRANWGNGERFDPQLPLPSELGLRTAEYIHYEHTAYLGHHEDSNSVFTISIALSHPHEYQGGMFHLWSGEAMFKVPRLSAIAFLAETMHSITQVTGGERNVFVVELWRRPDSPLGMIRPIPATFDEYLRQHDLHGSVVDKQ